MKNTTYLSLALLGVTAASSAVASQPTPARKAPGKRISSTTKVAPSVTHNKYSLNDNFSAEDLSADANSRPLRITTPDELRRARAASSSLNESFEEFPGQPNSWLPTGWTLDSKSGKDSWKICGLEGDFKPTNGKYQAFISSENSATEMEEWLISPEFTPTEGLRLYADITASLFSIYDPQYFDKATKEFSKRKVTATLSVKVYCDGSWSEIYNVRDLAARLEDADLYDNHYSPEVHTARLSLSPYAGKPIKIAFVYTGSQGGDMALDYISTGQPNNMAVYRRPQGFFFEGIAVNWGADQNFAPLVGPAYTDATWFSEYTRDVEKVKWTFTDPYDYSQVVESEEWHPSIYYPYAVAYAPEITAQSDGFAPLTYQFDIANEVDGIVKYGGGGVDWDENDNVIEYGCGAYNWRCGVQAPVFADEQGAYLFGPSSNKRFWNTARLELKGIGSYYERPLTPYIFDKVWLNIADIDADSDAPLTLNIYKIDEYGQLNYPAIASSTVKVQDVIRYNTEDGGHLFTILFPFELQTIDSAILMEFTGFMDSEKVRVFSPLCQNNPHVDGENNGYLYIDNGKGVSLTPSSSILSNFYCPFIFTFNATYPFLIADDDIFVSPEEGGEKDFEIISYYTPSSWTIEEDIPEWIDNIEPVEYTDSEGEYHSILRIATAPLPDSEKGRSWKFTLLTPGCSKAFTINQGDLSGLSSVASDICRSGMAYDINGNVLGRVSISGNGAVEHLREDAKGVIIVILDNGKAIKFIR